LERFDLPEKAKNRLAFGNLDLSSTLPLRGFERYFGMKSREGSEAWTSIYPSVQRLLNHLSRYTKSESSREKYLNLLRMFCEWSGYDPNFLVKMQKGRVEALVQSFADRLASMDRSRTYVNSVIKKLKTFFRVNGFADLKVATYFVPSRYRKRPEYVPTKNEVHNMASAAGSPRNRAIIFMLWSSGLRVSTMCALNYGDVSKELESGETCVKIPVYPQMKTRVPDACKGSIPYYTFIFSEVTNNLKIYLREREERYGPINLDDPLFHSEWTLWNRDERSEKRLGRRAIAKIVRRSAKIAGILKWKHVTPHCLRKSFESVLRSPTIDSGRLDKGTQEFLFGHILPGSQDAYYDKTSVKFHRSEYAKLDFSRRSTRRLTDIVMAVTKIASAGLNEDPEEIVEQYARIRYGNKIAWKLWPETDQLSVIKQALEWKRSQQPRKESQPLDKVVETKELGRYLSKGWIFMARLEDGNVVIRLIR
jgi:integrase